MVERYRALNDICIELGVRLKEGIAWAEAGVISIARQDIRYYVTAAEAERMLRLGAIRLDILAREMR